MSYPHDADESSEANRGQSLVNDDEKGKEAPSSMSAPQEEGATAGGFDEVDEEKGEDNDDDFSVDAGKKAFMAGNYKQASKMWERSLKSIQYIQNKKVYSDEDEKGKEFLDLSCKIHLNLAQSSLKLDKWGTAVENAEKALQIEPNNTKGLYRLAVGLIGQCRYEKAMDTVYRLLCLEPESKIALSLKQQIRRLAVDALKKEKEMNKRIFPTPPPQPFLTRAYNAIRRCLCCEGRRSRMFLSALRKFVFLVDTPAFDTSKDE